MKLTQLNTIITLAVLIGGCDEPKSKRLPPPTHKTQIQIERVPESEDVLSILGRKAWVYKYSGGELKAEIKVYHHPAGAPAEETLLLHLSGDDLNIIIDSFGDNISDKSSGYLIITVPQSFDERLVKLGFSLDDRSIGSQGVIPKGVLRNFSNPDFTLQFGETEVAYDAKLEPNSNKQAELVDFKQTVWDSSTDAPPEAEREWIRYEVTTTAVE